MNIDLAKRLVNEDRVLDLFKLSRFFYRIGEPIINDQMYEALLRQIEEKFPESILLTQTYDDDEIPRNLLEEFGFLDKIPIPKENKEFYQLLNEDKSLSIQPTTSYEGAHNWYQSVSGKELILMLKMDGIYTKTLFLDGNPVLCLSRGRTGDSFDFTETAVRYVLPHKVDVIDTIRVYGEAFVPTEYLDILREKTNRFDRFTTTKGGALSLLRVEHQQDLYEYVKQIMFDADGLADTKSETLNRLEEMGFLTVPYIVIPPDTLSGDVEEFRDKLRPFLDEMYQKAQESFGFVIPTDGLVLEVNDKVDQFDIHNQYSSRNIAIKFEHWSYEYYRGVIEEIVLTPRRTRFSVRVKIKKLVTQDRCTATWINGFNLNILNNYGLVPGSAIYFSRASNAYNNLIYGPNLQKILLEGGDEVNGEGMV